MCIISSFHAWDHVEHCLVSEFFGILLWYLLFDLVAWNAILDLKYGEGHWILLGDYARDFCCIHASNHLEHCFVVSVMVQRWYPPLWWFGCAWNAMLDLNCVEDHWFCWEIIILLLRSCIRSFRALLWVILFATMISAIVMIWLCLQGHHGIRIMGKGI